MSKEEIIQLSGIVKEPLPGTKFKVELENGEMILAHLAGKLKMHYIKILPGDEVQVEISPYDLTKGRITYRNSGKKPPNTTPPTTTTNEG